jgi:hypothetical protein
MGLFDAYDPNTYAPGADQSGLIDRILASVAAAPTNAGAGFPALPVNANAAMPAAPAPPPTAPQNAPIAVGDYQMPRIGSGFLPDYPQHDPHTGETVAPMQQAAQPAALAAPAPSSSIGDNLMTGFQNFQHGHNIVGSIVAAITGKRNDPLAEAQKQQQAQLQLQHAALVNAGLSPQEATIAVLNPDAGKALIAQKFGPQTVTSLGHGYIADKSGKVTRAYTPEQNDNFVTVQTGEDGLGKKTFSKMNKATGEMTPIANASGGDAGGGIGLGDMTKTGMEYLATIPPAQRGTVQAMLDGRLAPPGSFALSKPYWQNMIAAANNIDPTFDATSWSGRVAGVKDFSAGKSAEMVRSANQTLHHVGSLLDSMDALNNGNYPLINRIGNAASEASGSGAQGSFRTNAHAVAEELSKVFKGSNLSDAEIHAWEANLHENMSPEQQRTQVAKLKELLTGSLHALEEKRIAAIGPIAAEKAGPIIKGDAQRVMDRIDQWTKGDKSAAGALPTGWTVKVN